MSFLSFPTDRECHKTILIYTTFVVGLTTIIAVPLAVAACWWVWR